jgi:hypothetical protein
MSITWLTCSGVDMPKPTATALSVTYTTCKRDVIEDSLKKTRQISYFFLVKDKY